MRSRAFRTIGDVIGTLGSLIYFFFYFITLLLLLSLYLTIRNEKSVERVSERMENEGYG